ncbi:MAG: methyltransferase domain-containing protein [Proteobacteria bacterium]|nr:methyltransferase domain-containing protein [Pseudomonadota bacterium]
MEAYYRDRAPEYDRIYELPEWQGDLATLCAWVAKHTKDRVVLELAAGTGYWTKAAAPRAKAIVATDFNPEVLAVAAIRRLGPHVSLRTADAYALPEALGCFDIGMAHLWWSHVETHKQRRFLRQFARRLRSRATLLMIDQNRVPGFTYPTFRRDRSGNRYELRALDDGSVFQVVKNFPTDTELRISLSSVCDRIEIIRLRYFWSVRARIRASAGRARHRRHSGAG